MLTRIRETIKNEKALHSGSVGLAISRMS